MLSTMLLSFTVIILLVLFKNILSREYKIVRFYIKTYFYYIGLSFGPMLFIPYLMIRPKHHSNGVVTSIFMKHFINFIYGWKWQLRNKEILMEDKGAVIISNHQSVFDSTGVNMVWPVAKKVLLIAKKEVLLYTGPLGLAGYLCGAIFIDRNNKKDAYEKLEKTKQLMIRENYKTWIFPEGTRNTKCDGKLLPFKKGAFNLAVTAQVPIIPVVYSPYYFFDKDKYIFDKGRVIMQCLEPVPTVGLTLDDVPALTERLHQILSRAYEQLSKEVLSDSRGKSDTGKLVKLS